QILFENGRTEESVEPFRTAVSLAPDEPLIRLLLAQSLIETREPELESEAEAHLMEAFKHEPRNSFAWRMRAIVYERRGDTALAQLATAEQRYYSDPISARLFAARARQELQEGTPEWIRASDIVAAIEASIAIDGARGRGRGRR
ncbi:MAG: M48 family peptidase, partial [Caulobacterales bacterium]|nr:M48 family peptidase [Caulobacterales bacterium]